jgi:hypothetical protein
MISPVLFADDPAAQQVVVVTHSTALRVPIAGGNDVSVTHGEDVGADEPAAGGADETPAPKVAKVATAANSAPSRWTTLCRLLRIAFLSSGTNDMQTGAGEARLDTDSDGGSGFWSGDYGQLVKETVAMWNGYTC